MAATWVHEAEGITRAHHSLVECGRWTFCIWWKEGQGRSLLLLQFTSPVAQLYWGETLLPFGGTTAHSQSCGMIPATLTLSRKTKQTRTHMTTH